MRHADGHSAAGISPHQQKSVLQVAQVIGKTKRPSVIWLHFQDCTGCTETLLRTSAPDVAHLILDVISLDYHETLMAARARRRKRHCARPLQTTPASMCWSSKALFPTRDDGVYMELGGKPAVQVVQEVAAQAAAVIAIGSCASWGGVPSADPNPTGAVGVDSVISGKPHREPAGMPAKSLQPAGRGSGIRHHGQTARAGRIRPSEIRLRARDSRKLPAARAL